MGEPPLRVLLAELADYLVPVGVGRTDPVSVPPVTERMRTLRRGGAARVPFHGPEYQRGPAPAKAIQSTPPVTGQPGKRPGPIRRHCWPGPVPGQSRFVS